MLFFSFFSFELFLLLSITSNLYLQIHIIEIKSVNYEAFTNVLKKNENVSVNKIDKKESQDNI